MSQALVRVTILGDYSPSSETHRYTDSALQHSAQRLGLLAEARWISSVDVSNNIVLACDALWLAPGGKCEDLDRALSAIRCAREQGVPALGTCGGFQSMVIEYARNALGMVDADHAEYEPTGSRLVITPLACSLKGRTMRLALTPGSCAATLYGSLSAEERYYCSFGINPEVAPSLREGSFRPVGADADGAIRVMEMAGHPFFMGTLFVPQARSTAEKPHPLVTGFLVAAARRAQGRSSLAGPTDLTSVRPSSNIAHRCS